MYEKLPVKRKDIKIDKIHKHFSLLAKIAVI